jgi:predicted Fe-Mo cluster-binding NifX family protein
MPHFGKSIAPCFGHSATITILTLENNRVVEQVDFPLPSTDSLDRVRLLRAQQVDTLICGGIQDHIETMLRASGVNVISWVEGDTDELLALFLRDELVPNSGRLGCSEPPGPKEAEG